MNRLMSVVVAVCVVAGCSNGTSAPASSGSPAETVTPSLDTFAGSWRSVTPSLEFIRLSVVSKSSEKDALAARLTFSGVAWEGSGRIEGDAFVASMTIPGAAGASGVMVARPGDAQTLRVQMKPTNGATTDVTFVREN